MACKCLLPVTEVSLWLNHLRTIDNNRKRGVAKAAASRKSKKNELHTKESQQQGDGSLYLPTTERPRMVASPIDLLNCLS